MLDWGLLLLLVMAIAIGFFLGRRSSARVSEESAGPLQPHYIQGLNYLLNERPDAAIDTFIEALDVNSETLETHLALGNLLRRRGEVDRAIRIHQNLLARPRLSQEQSLQVQLELARDFIKAGLLDRAELLLQELIGSAPMAVRQQCLQYLIEIYRDEKEWQKGITAINQLGGRRFGRSQERWRLVQAHFYCELAEAAIDRGDHLKARRLLKAAMAADKQSARASLLLGRLEMGLEQYREALRSLRQVFHQDATLVAEALPLISECHQRWPQAGSLADYLDSLLAESGSVAVVLARAELIAREQGAVGAAAFLEVQPVSRDSLPAARALLHYRAAGQEPPEPALATALAVLDSLLQSVPRYHCQQCGFGGQQMHWLCPGCKSWGSVKPRH